MLDFDPVARRTALPTSCRSSIASVESELLHAVGSIPPQPSAASRCARHRCGVGRYKRQCQREPRARPDWTPSWIGASHLDGIQ